MPFVRTAVAVLLLAGGVSVSACHPPIPKAGPYVVPLSIGTEPVAAINRSGQAIQALCLNGLSALVGPRG